LICDTNDYLQIGKPNKEQACSLTVKAADK
jgi:hypothetical protein